MPLDAGNGEITVWGPDYSPSESDEETPGYCQSPNGGYWEINRKRPVSPPFDWDAYHAETVKMLA